MFNDDYLTTDTSVMSSSTPVATPNTPQGIDEVQNYQLANYCDQMLWQCSSQFCAATIWVALI